MSSRSEGVDEGVSWGRERALGGHLDVVGMSLSSRPWGGERTEGIEGESGRNGGRKRCGRHRSCVRGRRRSSGRSSLVESSFLLTVLDRERRFFRTRGVDFDESDSDLKERKGG